MTPPNLNWKMIAIVIGGLFAALVLAITLFIAFFPKELAAREAERRIEEATGRDLVLGGAISVSFWPALGFSVEQASLSNPEGFDNQTPFIAADRIVFAVAVMPLLRGEIEVRELIFEGADLRLQARDGGAANWTFPTENTESENETTIEDLRLDDVRLIDSMVTFQGAEGEPLVLENVNVALSLASLDSPAQINAAFDYRGERLDIDGEIGVPRAVLEKGETPLTARVRAAPLEASFDGGFNAESGALTGRIEASGASLRRLLGWIGSPMAEGGGFGAFRVAAQMAREGERTDFTDAVVRLDAIEARGTLALVGQQNGRLRIAGALNAGAVDVNPYLPAPAQNADGSGVEVNTAWSQAPLDLTGLRAVDADLNLTLASLRFQQMTFSNVALGLRLANGALDARLTRISLYGGSGTARLIADGAGATPRIAVELDAQNIQAEPLLTDAIGLDRITGRGRLQLSLVGAGGSQAAIMRSLRGNAAFNFNDGQWKGVNLAQVARTVQSAITGQAAGGNVATDFAELSATFAVADGVAATDSLRLLNPFVRLEGAGVINIGAQTIDMRLVPRAVRSAQGQGGQANVAGIGVPFRVSGPWSRVSFRPALEEIVQDQLRNVLSQQEQGSVLSRLGETLFGRQPAAETTAPETQTQTQEQTQNQTQGQTQQQQGQTQQEQPRNPLESIFRRAQEERQREREERRQQQQQQEAPAATP